MFKVITKNTKMLYRIFTGWTFTRALYTGLGIFLIIEAARDAQWLGVLLGVYFASMGIFAFGCAAGNCYTGATFQQKKTGQSIAPDEIHFEEIKNK